MSMVPKLWTLNGLATELRHVPRTVGRALRGIPADGKVGTRDAWYLTTALGALRTHEFGSDQLGQRYNGHGANGSGDNSADILHIADQLEDLNDRLLREMETTQAEPDLGRRREQIKEWGPMVGQIDRLLRRSFDLQGIPSVGEAFADKVLRHLAGNVLYLGGWECGGEAPREA